MKRILLIAMMLILAGCGANESSNDTSVRHEQEDASTSVESSDDANDEKVEIGGGDTVEEFTDYGKEEIPEFITDVIQSEDTSKENPAPIGQWVEVAGMDDDSVYKAYYIRVTNVVLYKDDPEYISKCIDEHDKFRIEWADGKDIDIVPFDEDWIVPLDYKNIGLVEYEVYYPKHFENESIWASFYPSIGDEYSALSGNTIFNLWTEADNIRFNVGEKSYKRGLFEKSHKLEWEDGLDGYMYMDTLPDGTKIERSSFSSLNIIPEPKEEDYNAYFELLRDSSPAK